MENMTQFEIESKPVLYRFIRAIMKMAMFVFFQKIELQNGENVPSKGSVVFVANHPNSIMDALVMGVVTKRKVNYIGHAGLFSTKLKARFLRSCGVIPVYRPEDSPENMEQNVAAFEACYRTLEKGEAIGIFPEGTSDMLRKVKKVKTGAARIILETERRNNYNLGIKVLPIGLYFFSRSRFRSKVLVNVGKAIDLKTYFELNKDDNYKAVYSLTYEIQKHLERLTVNIRHEELDEFVHDIEILYQDELKKENPELTVRTKSTATDFILTQKIAECVEFFFEHEPRRVQTLQDQITVYKRKLKRLHLTDAMLKEKQSFWQLIRTSAKTFGGVVWGLPLAIYGIINNSTPYFIAEYFAKKFIIERTKILSALLIGGGSAFIIFYTLQIFLVWYFFGVMWSSVYSITLPISGLFALAYLKEIRRERERISFSFFLFTNRQLFNKMRRERRKLIATMNTIKDEYLNIIGIETKVKTS